MTDTRCCIRVPFARVVDLENLVSLFRFSGSRVENPRRRPVRPRGRCTRHSGSGSGGGEEHERAHAKSCSGGDGSDRYYDIQDVSSKTGQM